MRRTGFAVACLVVMLALVGRPIPVVAQGSAGSIQGTVQGESGQPLSEARVGVLGSQLGAITRSDGRYVILGVPPGSYTVRVRRIGYAVREQQVTVPAGESATADFQLPTAAVSLDQIVVTGYGASQKRDVTGSISSVSGSDFATVPVARVDQAISGLVAGAQIQTTNAQPGSEMRLRIRGGNSLNASNEPLIVADGVIGADMNQINPNDIESVEILKDASARAIYGARASNGVILLTTKRGQSGKMRFEYSGYTGTQETTKHIDVLNADQFARLFMRNPNHDKSVTFDTTKSLPTTDWQDRVYRAAPMESHELRLSGSTDGTSLMVSGGWLNQQGIVRGSSFGRGNVRFNLDQTLGKKVRAGTRLSYSRSVGNEVRVNDGYGSAGGPITMMTLRFAPTIAPYDSTGGYSGPLLSSQTMDNPLAIAALRDNKSTTDYILGNVFAEYQVISGLMLRSSFGYTSSNLVNQRYTSRLLRAALNSGQANIDNTDRTSWLSENTAELRRTVLRNHEVTLLGGFTAQQSRRAANSEQGIGFTSDLLGYRRLNLAETVTGNSSSTRERLMSFLGRVNYNVAGKYLLTGTLRSDGSSKFAVNNKWATFPSVAVGWRASEEPFFRKHLPAINEMKFRGSYGLTGSEAISAYQSLAAWSVGSPYSIGITRFNNGATPSRIANPNLRWETTAEYNLGLDLALFNNRVGLTADAYRKRTSDLLYTKQVPYFAGFEDYTTNIGTIQNRGLEMELDTRHAVGPFDVRLGGNVSFNRSKVLELGGDKEFTLDGVNGSLPRFRPAAIVRVGEPLGNFYGYIWDGIYQDSASAANSGQAGARMGGDKLKDISGPAGVPDGKVDTFDRTILGNAQPKYMFGQTGTVAYRSFSVSYLVRGVQGFKIANLNRQGMETPGGDSNMLPSVLEYWSPTNPTNQMTGLGIGPFDGMTSRWIEDGSFIRLQNVTVGWTLPRRFAARANADELRVYLSGQNLFTHTRYSWYDPEVSSRGTSDLDLGWDDSSYPGVRTFTLGWTAIF
jgi:TonB-linked SusC/RagA family outer membrane protein